MSHRIRKLSAIFAVAIAGMAIVQFPVHAIHDLDLYSDDQLNRDLYDELDDILVSQGGQMEPDEEYSIEELRTEILDALADQGDEGLEDDIDRADLDLEMQEANTTVEEMLDDALAEADLVASQSEIALGDFVKVNFPSDSLFYAQSRNQRSKPNLVIPAFTTRLISRIRSSR